MKTAISIPDDDFQAAEKLAARLGISRSELYQRAILSFVERHSDQKVTEQLDKIYDIESDSSLEDDLIEMQSNSIASKEW